MPLYKYTVRLLWQWTSGVFWHFTGRQRNDSNQKFFSVSGCCRSNRHVTAGLCPDRLFLIKTDWKHRIRYVSFSPGCDLNDCFCSFYWTSVSWRPAALKQTMKQTCAQTSDACEVWALCLWAELNSELLIFKPECGLEADQPSFLCGNFRSSIQTPASLFDKYWICQS